MKKLLFLFLILLKLTTSNAQTLSLSQLFDQVNCSDFTCYNLKIIAQGFTYKMDTTFPAYKSKMFISDKKIENGEWVFPEARASFNIGRREKEIMVSYGTLSKETYLKILTELSKTDFKSTELTKTSKNIETYYNASTQFPKMTIMVTIIPDKFQKQNEYFFTVTRKL